MKFETLTISAYPPWKPRRECEVQPSPTAPDGCKVRACYEVRFLDGVSWVCSDHFKLIKAELDAEKPLDIFPSPPIGRH